MYNFEPYCVCNILLTKNVIKDMIKSALLLIYIKMNAIISTFRMNMPNYILINCL